MYVPATTFQILDKETQKYLVSLHTYQCSSNITLLIYYNHFSDNYIVGLYLCHSFEGRLYY